jgi:hypothetical protein
MLAVISSMEMYFISEVPCSFPPSLLLLLLYETPQS